MSDLAQVHDDLRPLMFSIAYRMLGSVAEAEDVVQDSFLRMHKATTTGTAIENAEAFATTVTTRVAIDALRSARVRRETYVGSWLPEPLLDDDSDPAHRIELDETVSVAFLVLLERLAPVERAVFLLREVFGYEFTRIAVVVDKAEANCRQILVRARRHINQQRPRPVPTTRRDELAGAFFSALEDGDLDSLERVLAEDIVFVGDGGGKAPAIRHPLEGRVAVTRFLHGLMRQGARIGARTRRTTANGQPALLLLAPTGALIGVLTLDVGESGVATLRNQINPDKLHHLGPVGDLAALLSGAG